MRRSILACGLLLAFAGMTTAGAALAASGGTESSPSPTASTTTTAGATESRQGPSRWELRTAAVWRRHIRRFRTDTQHWLTVMRGHPTNVSRAPATRSLERLQQLVRRWRHRAHSAWWHATHPPNLQAWNCIHHYEGSWTDPNAPYWGGLQMDYNFQSAYGAWLLKHEGTADHWTPLAQIWAGVRAWRVRGFEPWSSTAHACGVY